MTPFRPAAFAALLAASLLLDQMWWGGFEIRSLHGLVVLAACWVLARPAAVGRCAVLLAVTTVSVAADLPFVGTHRVVQLVVAVALLVHLGVGAVRPGSRGRWRLPDPVELERPWAGFLRAVVVVVYLASALAKVNTSFLDPAVSCASPMARPLVGAGLTGPAVLATVAAEALLPVLLLVRPTRLVGLVLGTGFHVVLALAGNVPFSALMLALYVGVVPADTAARLGVGTGRRWPRAARAGVFTALVGGWLAGAAVGPSDPAPGLTGVPSAVVSPTTGLVAFGGYLVLAVGGVALVLGSRWRARRKLPDDAVSLGDAVSPDAAALDGGGPARPGRAAGVVGTLVLAAGVAVLVVNAAGPYVGLKTDTSFEMFSGLRTEPGAWNHLLVPEAVRMSGLSGGWVTVTAATDPALVARTAAGTRIAVFELDRALRREPGAVATYTTAGDPAPHTLGPLPPHLSLAQHLVTFRDAPPVGVPRC